MSIFGSHTRGLEARAPDVVHGIHQNECLVKPYQENKKKMFTKTIIVTMAIIKQDDFAYFSIFVAPTLVKLIVNIKLLVPTPGLHL